jgi:hypothetical protein
MKLLELAESWEAWAEEASAVARNMTDALSAEHLCGQVQARIECATALRNHAADHPEETP